MKLGAAMLTAFAIILSYGQANAEGEGDIFLDGNKLLKECEITHPSFVCAGYVMAISDEIAGRKACVPTKATLGQIMDVVAVFLTNNPQMRHLPAPGLVSAAIAQAFPC